VRQVNQAEAAIVKRIFEMTRDGLGLAKIRGVLNREGVRGPRGAWAVSGVREVLHRSDYKGLIYTNRIQRGRDEEGNEVRIEQPQEQWIARQDESLRIVSDQLWDAAHARVATRKKAYLRRGHLLVG
jgi:site-specific DNA recombinase